jgi:hypothetical protein
MSDNEEAESICLRAGYKPVRSPEKDRILEVGIVAVY